MLIKGTTCSPENYLATLKFGTKLGGKPLTNIDYPVVIDSAKVYDTNFLWYLGVDLDGYINEKYNFCIDFDYVSRGLTFKNIGFEHKGIIVYPFLEKWTVAIGYKTILSKTSSGLNFFAIPFFDVSYKFVRKKFDDKKLFEEKMF